MNLIVTPQPVLNLQISAHSMPLIQVKAQVTETINVSNNVIYVAAEDEISDPLAFYILAKS